MAKLLLVDDQADEHVWMRIALETAGHEVRTAGNARDAMAVIPTFKPDLVVTDVLMPEMDGLAFASQVQLRHHIPSLVVSVVQREADAVIAGASGFLRKPATASDLRTAVENALGRDARDVPILVVDDDEDIRVTYRMILEPRFQVIEAGHGAQALEILSEKEVALLITDVHMPIMDGRELVRAIRAIPRLQTLPIVVQTQDTSAAREPIWRTLDVSHALTKVEYMTWLLDNVEHAEPEADVTTSQHRM